MKILQTAFSCALFLFLVGCNLNHPGHMIGATSQEQEINMYVSSSSYTDSSSLMERITEFNNSILLGFGYDPNEYIHMRYSDDDVPDLVLHYLLTMKKNEGDTLPSVYQLKETKQYLLVYQSGSLFKTVITFDLFNASPSDDNPSDYIIKTEQSPGTPVDFNQIEPEPVPQVPSSYPADDSPKTLVSSSQWIEHDGEFTFINEEKSYVYD